MSRLRLPLLVLTSLTAMFTRAALAQPQPQAGPKAAPAPQAPETEEYTVVAGDSCLSIAIRVLGSRKALADLHRLNPGLGPTPHALTPGRTLVIPRRAPRAPDANLTAARGEVEVRRPAQSDWDAAQRGMDLFRAWRVGARAKASAEVTFRDTSSLRLRENTVVVIYGPSAARAPAAPVRAELEGGSLEARLAAATGGAARPAVAGPEILTPSALATLAGGAALVSVDPAGTSLVANHAGAPVAVRAVTRKQPRGPVVRVASGMGSRIQVGKLPEPPRPLPPPPAFPRPKLLVATFGASATVELSWQAAPGAVRYRAVVFDAQGAEQNAVMIPPGETSFALAEVPAGALRVELAAIDADGFEGAPASLDVRVVEVALAQPAGDAPTTVAPAGPAAAATPRKLALGARLLAPPGLRCGLVPAADDAPDAATTRDVAAALGPHRARCADEGGASDEASDGELVEVVGISATVVGATPVVARGATAAVTLAIRSEAPLGADVTARGDTGLAVEAQRWDDGALAVTLRASGDAAASSALRVFAGDVEVARVPIAISAEAPPLRRAATWQVDLGGFAGLVLPPADSRLGGATRARDQLASGPTLGARLAVRRLSRPWLAGRLELSAAALSQRGTSSTASTTTSSAALALRAAAAGPLSAWAFGGASLTRLSIAPGSLHPQTSASLDLGGGLTLVRAGLALHLDAVWRLRAPGDQRELWPSVQLGVSSTFAR